MEFISTPIGYICISLFFLALSLLFSSKNNKTDEVKKEKKGGSRENKTKMKNLKIGKKYVEHLLKQLNQKVDKDSSNSIASAKQILKNIPNYDSSVIPSFTIVYASQSNTAKRFAEKFSEEAGLLKIKTKLKNISEVDYEELEKNLFVVFFAATYGEGGPTDDCIEFFDFMDKNKAGIKNTSGSQLHYSIFGCGSSKYEFFNQVAKKIDNFLSKCGFKRLFDIGLGDDSKKITEDFESWKVKFWPEIYSYFKTNSLLVQAHTEKLKVLFKDSVKEYNIEIISPTDKAPVEAGSTFEINENDYDFVMKKFQGSKSYKINKIEEMRQSTDNGSTLLVNYDISNTDFDFEVADSIGVYAKNNFRSVNFIEKRLKYNLSSVVKITKLVENASSKLKIINGITIGDILAEVVDLSFPLNKEIIDKLKKYCMDEDQFAELIELTNKEKKFNDFIAKNLNICDFLELYDSISLPFLDFYYMMPKITPRYYTVASSKSFRRDNLNIVISLVDWKTTKDKIEEKRFGLASGYYRDLFFNKSQEALITRLTVKNSVFRLPKEDEAPLLMISTGTGVAPFIAFFEDKLAKKETSKTENFHKSFLFFGSKNSSKDFIFKSDLTSYRDSGLYAGLITAFSRDQEKKYYVQDALIENKNIIVDLLLKQNGYLYICGGVAMGSDVMKAIERILSEVLREESGQIFLKRLEENGKLLKELWG